jgi:septal ring factor EnvC (AmiA/AmiB activator)
MSSQNAYGVMARPQCLKLVGVDGMRSRDVALRLSIVLWIAGFIALAAGLYEVDRREKSSSGTVAANLTKIEQHVQILSNQIGILSNQLTRQLSASERQVQALSSQIEALDLRLKELEDDLRGRR